MNGPFKAVSDRICLTQIINAADAIPASGASRKTNSMRMVFTHHVTGDAGAFDVFLVPVDAEFGHGEP